MVNDSGYIPSMMDFGTFIGGVAVGYLGDRFGKRSLFLAPLMLLSTMMMLVAKFLLSDVPLPYFFVIFFMGLGLGGPYNIIGKFIGNVRNCDLDRPWFSVVPEGKQEGHFDCDGCHRWLWGAVRGGHAADASRDESRVDLRYIFGVHLRGGDRADSADSEGLQRVHPDRQRTGLGATYC